MRRKSNLTLNRTKTHKKQPNIKTLKLLKCSWIRTEDEIYCYSNKKLSAVVCRTEITSKKTVFSPKCVRITPSKTGTPRKQLKRNLLKSPKELLRQSINDKKTPSKSPYTKKVRKCLEDELFDNHDIETTCSSFNPGSSLDQSLGQGDRMADIQNLIPNVLENLAEVGCDETFIEFLNQVNNGEFPLQNISFLLWMEVVKWFS